MVASLLRRDRIVGNGLSCSGLRTHQPIECERVRDHQYGDVDDGDYVGGA